MRLLSLHETKQVHVSTTCQ